MNERQEDGRTQSAQRRHIFAAVAVFALIVVVDARPYLDRFVREAPPQRYGADVVRIQRMLAR